MRALVLLPLLAACGDPRVNDILALTGDATAGLKVYTANCETCHGPEATGGSAPELASHFETNDEHITAIVYGEDEMPAFGDVLTDQEIADVSAYLSGV